MEPFIHSANKRTTHLALICFCAAISTGTIVSLAKIYSLTKQTNELASSLLETKETLNIATAKLYQNVTELDKETKGLSGTLLGTQKNIEVVQTQVGGVVQSVNSISGTVGTLQKLAVVDKELLKKYSKVYFMNENYTPKHLSQIPAQYIYSTSRTEQFVSEALPSLISLLETAKRDGIPLYIKSGYRSFTEQKNLKTSYTVLYGAGTANKFSADQGYSEHQLGTTVDFISTGTGGNLAGFDTTQAYIWMTNNAYKFGFILSYPKNNAYYIYEPWHWRYVGVPLATYIHNNNLNFYDLDQRTIDEYLVSIFE